jgi:hypothetical protein
MNKIAEKEFVESPEWNMHHSNLTKHRGRRVTRIAQAPNSEALSLSPSRNDGDTTIEDPTERQPPPRTLKSCWAGLVDRAYIAVGMRADPNYACPLPQESVVASAFTVMKVSVIALNECVLMQWPLSTVITFLASRPQTLTAISLLVGADVSAKLLRRSEETAGPGPLQYGLGGLAGTGHSGTGIGMVWGSGEDLRVVGDGVVGDGAGPAALVVEALQFLREKLKISDNDSSMLLSLARWRQAKYSDTMLLQTGEEPRLLFMVSGTAFVKEESIVRVAGSGTFIGAASLVGGMETIAWTREACVWLDWDAALLSRTLRCEFFFATVTFHEPFSSFIIPFLHCCSFSPVVCMPV